jgi:hypothetical protein
MAAGSSMISLQLTPVGALDGSRPSLGDGDQQPTDDLCRAELLLSFGDLAAAIRDSIVRRTAQRLAARIHVSPMSLTWLRVHDIEYDKHRVEL